MSSKTRSLGIIFAIAVVGGTLIFIASQNMKQTSAKNNLAPSPVITLTSTGYLAPKKFLWK